MNLYFDTSALMRRYLNRRGGPEFDQQIEAAARVATVSLTRVEATTSLTRLASGGAITRLAARQALRQLEGDMARIWQIPVDAGVIQDACRLGQQHLLKGYDAVHLAAAASWRSVTDGPVLVAAFDDQLWAAAQGEGFAMWPPDLQAFK